MDSYSKTVHSSKGFTLIELLVVIAIIGVLAAVVLLAINPNELIKKGRDSTRMSDLGTIRKAIDITSASNAATVLGCTTICSTAGTPNRSSTGTSGWMQTDLGAYIPTLPVDPVNTGQYVYYFQSNSAGEYELNALLESNTFTSGTSSKYITDGGDNNAKYEVGTNITIIN